MLLKLRERMSSEKGFTLIELLVVMLIIGILAAIAIPTFFNQRNKASDSSAKEMAHTAQVAAETVATDNNGSYATVAPNVLAGIDASIRTAAAPAGEPPKPYVSAATGTTDSWTVTVTSQSTGNTFTITKATGTGALTYPCTAAGTDRGGCPSSNFWG
jgi:type IV pilus assembly protein PilA